MEPLTKLIDVPARPLYVWRLSRHPSIRPGLMLTVLGVLALITLSIAVFWATRGAWVVLPFALIEISALAIAFWYHARHAGDMERVLLTARELQVEQFEAGEQRSFQLVAHQVRLRVELSTPGRSLVWLEDGVRRVQIARLVGETQRRVFVEQLRAALTQLTQAPMPT